MKIDVSIGEHTYPYYLYRNMEALSTAMNRLTAGYMNTIVIYDPNVPESCMQKLLQCYDREHFQTIAYAVTESNKTLETVGQVLDLLMQHDICRDTCVFAMGGGVLGNVVGLACGLIYRGVPFVHVPTTVMACSDSVLSLKQGVNRLCAKNIVGMYYAPLAVMSCPGLYESLPARDVTAGYVEFVKNLQIVAPEEIETFLAEPLKLSCMTYEKLEQLVTVSVKSKMKLIAGDMHEKKEGVLLEYGHTVGHALEMLLPDVIRHGESVAFGMLVAAELSCARGYFGEEERQIVRKLMEKINVLHYLRQVKEKHPNLNLPALKRLLQNDNKRGYISCGEDAVAMVLLEGFGQPLKSGEAFVTPVNLDEILIQVERIWEDEI